MTGRLINAFQKWSKVSSVVIFFVSLSVVPPIRALNFHPDILFPLTNTPFCSFPYFFPLRRVFCFGLHFSYLSYVLAPSCNFLALYRRLLSSVELFFSSLSHCFARTVVLFSLSVILSSCQSYFFPLSRTFLLSVALFSSWSYFSPLSCTFFPLSRTFPFKSHFFSSCVLDWEEKSTTGQKEERQRGKK